jgi:hypothetical protein
VARSVVTWPGGGGLGRGILISAQTKTQGLPSLPLSTAGFGLLNDMFYETVFCLVHRSTQHFPFILGCGFYLFLTF